MELRFTPKVAALILERPWHPAQVVTELADGGLKMELQVTHSPELSAALGRRCGSRLARETAQADPVPGKGTGPDACLRALRPSDRRIRATLRPNRVLGASIRGCMRERGDGTGIFFNRRFRRLAQINTSAPVGFGTMGAVVLGLSLALTEFRVGCGGVETICANRRNLRLNRCCDGGDVEVVTPFRRNFQWSRLARRGIREP